MNWGNEKIGGDGSGLASLLRCRCASGWDFLDLHIFRASCGWKVGTVPSDFLLGFGVFYLSNCVSDVELLFFELERYVYE
jgi:hypothetical protein